MVRLIFSRLINCPQRDGKWEEVRERVLHEQLWVHLHQLRGGELVEVQGRLLEGLAKVKPVRKGNIPLIYLTPREDGYYELDNEKGMFPVLQQLMPQVPLPLFLGRLLFFVCSFVAFSLLLLFSVPCSPTTAATDDRGCLEGTCEERWSRYEVSPTHLLVKYSTNILKSHIVQIFCPKKG